jgi:predicted DNA-binding protein YlxM (UPF0122 family)
MELTDKEFEENHIKQCIKNYEKKLNEAKKALEIIQAQTSIKTKELYNGLITNLKTEIKDEECVNDLYGLNQSETEPFKIYKTAYVDIGNIYLTDEQKRIIKEYHERESEIEVIRFNGKKFK